MRMYQGPLPAPPGGLPIGGPRRHHHAHHHHHPSRTHHHKNATHTSPVVGPAGPRPHHHHSSQHQYRSGSHHTRHHHHHRGPIQPPVHTEVSPVRPRKQLSVENDLVLSEDSADEEEPRMTDTRLFDGHNGVAGNHIETTPGLPGPPLSPISPKTSEESSTSDDTSDDSDGSSEDERQESPPASSPEPAEDKSEKTWSISNFLPKKINSPLTTPAPGPGPALAAEDGQVKRELHPSPSPFPRGPRPAAHRIPSPHSSDSSIEGPPRPTPRSRASQQVFKDSQPRPRNTVSPKCEKVEKTAKSAAPSSRETSRKSRKSAELKKDNQGGAKSENKSRRQVKSNEYVATDSDDSSPGCPKTDNIKSRRQPIDRKSTTDSDDSLIDVVTTTPEKVQKVTPTRTPKDFPKPIPSPVKAVQASPHMSPMTSSSINSRSAKRNSSRLSESISTESLVTKSDDEVNNTEKGLGSSHKHDLAREKVNQSYSVLSKKDKIGREKDPAETRKKDYGDTRKISKTDRRTLSDTGQTDSRHEGRAPSASPRVSSKQGNSPIVSAEPKVPIPQIQYENGVARLPCTIPLSFIDKVPKHSENGATVVYKAEVKQEIKQEIVDTKDVLDNRTREGKGKRKTSDPNTKTCNDKSKSKILTSIFKVKKEKEVKSEPVGSDEEVDIKESRQQRKKKKKDKQPEKTPPTRERKRARSNSESNSAWDSCDPRRSRRDPSGESERSTVSRKRDHERESSLESTKSSSRMESAEKSNKKARLCKEEGVGAEVPLSSPSVKVSSQRIAEDSQHAQEEDVRHPKNTQRSKHSQHSSQSKSGGEEVARTQESEYEEDTTTATSHSTLHGDVAKVKVEASNVSGSTENLHQPRGTSEHESTVERAAYTSSDAAALASQPGTTEVSAAVVQTETGNAMVPPGAHRHLTTTGDTKHHMHPLARQVQDQGVVHGSYVSAHERHYGTYFARPEVNRDYTDYLNKAKELKHKADGETDRSMQAMQYLEAALYFILSAKAMENDQDPNAPLTMYKDTLNFIKWVSSVFRRENQEGGINSKLAVISLRCQSLLSLQIYKMRRSEHKENQRQLNKYFQNAQNAARAGGVDGHGNTATGGTANWGVQRATVSPSHLSQTPSPAGSVGSEGSQSSGYTTSTESKNIKGGAPPVGHTPPHGAIQTVPVPVSIHALIIKQNQLSGHLATAHDMWIEADNYLYMNGMEEFFQELDRCAGPLTLHTSLYDLVYYVMAGLNRLRS